MPRYNEQVSVNESQHRQARFWRKFMRLTRGRVGVVRALEVIMEEEADAGFRSVLQSLHDTVEKRAPLSDAIDAHPAEFSASVRELVRTAEKTGAWDDIISEIADGLAEGTFD